MQNYLTERDITHLKQHKYVGGSYTYLDNAMNHFWYFCLNFVPMWLPANAITFIGNLGYNLVIVLATLSDPSCQTEQPRWVYFLIAFAIFFYQTMDALDGKQARRTKTSSPLGQLVDHGCDCVSTTFFNYNALAFFAAGGDSFTVYMCFIGLITVFYMANWAERFTGVLVTSQYGFGVTEVQFLYMLLNILTGIYGTGIWQYEVLGKLNRF